MELFVLSWTGTALTCVFRARGPRPRESQVHRAFADGPLLRYSARDPRGGGRGKSRWCATARTPPSQYSDMNGYQAFLSMPSCGSDLLVGIRADAPRARLRRVRARGRETGLAARLRAGRRTRLTIPAIPRPRSGWARSPWRAASSSGTPASCIHETARTASATRRRTRRSSGEKTKPQPSIIAFDGSFDVFPAERRWSREGRLSAEEQDRAADLARDAERERPRQVRGADHRRRPGHESDDRPGVKIFTLPAPIAAGEEAELAFDMARSRRWACTARRRRRWWRTARS